MHSAGWALPVGLHCVCGSLASILPSCEQQQPFLHPPQGMLNVWHLVAYQRYYDGLISATGGSQHSGSQQRQAAQLNAMGSNIVDVSWLVD